MSDRELHRLAAAARELRWPFPSSYGLPTPRSDTALRDLAQERARFAEAALRLLEAGDRPSAEEIAASTWRLWVIARDAVGGRAFLGRVLDASTSGATGTRSRALALYGDGLLALWQGAVAESKRRNEEARAIGDALADAEVLALAHLGLSRAALEEGRFEEALAEAQRARRYAASLGDGMKPAPLHLHAQSLRALGRHDEAARLFRESLALNRSIGDDGMVEVELSNLGHVELARGDFAGAEGCFREAEAMLRPGDGYGAALVAVNHAALELARGNAERARADVARATQTLAEHGIELAADDQRELDRIRGALAG